MKAGSLSQPLYAVTTTGGTGALGTGLGGARGLGTGGTLGNTAVGFNTMGYPRAPAYTTRLDFTPPPRTTTPTVMRANIQQLISNAPTLNGNGQRIQVAVNGSTVVLRGTVETDRQRRVAEIMARLNPGVRDVVNEIQVPTPAKSPSE
jgi:hypothetical protein